MKRANICMMWLTHGFAAFPVAPLAAPRVRSGPNTHCAIIAPTFPDAAENPCEDER